MEVTLDRSTSTLTTLDLLEDHVNNTLLTTSKKQFLLLPHARTAPGLHALKVRLARINAGLSKTPDTTSATTTVSEELIR
jgi:hypothetical protein